VENRLSETIAFLRVCAQQALPRILTQICRDPTSPLYGCCDRNWWHYKITDFPSIILQQAGYAIAVASQLDLGLPFPAELRALASATCRFWNERATRFGAFEEYYPYERGYPPLAFSTLAVANLCAEGVVCVDDVRTGLRKAVRQLLRRFEEQAANQQVAGTAALAVLRKVAPELVPEKAFQDLLSRTLALQTLEGWFPEYEGPDLGYLSVAMDCLWDIYDATGDHRCMEALERALDYMAWFVLGPIGGAGIHNSRNTDYVVPYGLARLACSQSSSAGRAGSVLSKLYKRDANGPHFLDSVDDRYWCHYIGHSVFRALRVLTSQDVAGSRTLCDTERPKRMFMPESGHALLVSRSSQSLAVLISGRKGGILTAVWSDGRWVTDLGWVVVSSKRVFVSHWWSRAWQVQFRDGALTTAGPMVSHKEHVSTVPKHMMLRLASLVLGSRLMRLLKRLMIFKKSGSRLTFKRTVHCEGGGIVVTDEISGLRAGDQLRRAPRASKRHVSSADSFHREDLVLLQGVTMAEDLQRDGDRAVITTRYEVEAR